MNRYIADLHFGHANIIKFDNRHFDSVEEMNETLINNWNKKVKSGDTTYILGDFCWGKELEWIEILILSHYPEMAYKSSYNPNVFMLHGHVHYHTGEATYIHKWVKELRENRSNDWDNRGQIINVGCMLPEMDYTPRTLMEILHANGYCLDEDLKGWF